MAAQRMEEFPPDVARAIGRRMGMLMAAAGIETNRELGVNIGVSESQVGRWRKGLNVTWAVAPKVTKGVKGRCDISTDGGKIRAFLELQSDEFPWGDAAVTAASGESILYSTKPPSDQGFRALALA